MGQEAFFIGEIRMFGGNFAPRTYAFCDGQLLPIAQNTALFSILGTTYGGDGRTTFGLPSLRGRVPVHAGNGPGLTPRRLGEKSGQETVTLNITEIPSHNHSMAAGRIEVGEESKTVTKLDTASGNYLGNATALYRANPGGATLNNNAISGNTSNQGASQSHNNMQPYQVVNYIIALQGRYPSRS